MTKEKTVKAEDTTVVEAGEATAEAVVVPVAAETATVATPEGITVQDPEEVRPKALPLLITPDSGAWKNAEQEEYARILNGYAYKNPKKWGKKKEVLLKQLVDIGNDPEKLALYRGNGDSVAFKNHLIEG